MLVNIFYYGKYQLHFFNKLGKLLNNYIGKYIMVILIYTMIVDITIIILKLLMIISLRVKVFTSV